MSEFHENPAFACSLEAVLSAWEAMRGALAPLARPVLVLNGYRAPWFTASGVASRLCSVTSGRAADFLAVSYTLSGSVESAAEHATRRIRANWPEVADGIQEVDVVGISMGGLVARLLASELSPRTPKLRIARLFTLATPHRGAILAEWFHLDRAARQMRRGSEFLTLLNGQAAKAAYELHCYAQLRDWWVGARNASPPGVIPVWTDAESFFGRVHSHVQITRNKRILADVARRLRGEPALAGVGTLPPRD